MNIDCDSLTTLGEGQSIVGKRLAKETIRSKRIVYLFMLMVKIYLGFFSPSCS